MKKIYLIPFFALLIGATTGFAQIQTPAPSPTGKITQNVGLANVEVEYSRPGVKDRVIFGDLVPYDQMWRTGANKSTQIKFSEDVKFGGVAVPKGDYALYTVPGKKEWEFIIYKNTSFWGVPGDEFTEDDVAARVKVPSKAVSGKVETFTIEIANITSTSADLQLMWENTMAAVPMTFETDAQVMASIKKTMAGPSGRDNYLAASYYLDEGKDMKQALTWIDKAIEMDGEKFWYLRVKANILGEMGRYSDAIDAANKSSEMAKKEGNEGYPRMNAKSIAEWKKKM